MMRATIEGRGIVCGRPGCRMGYLPGGLRTPWRIGTTNGASVQLAGKWLWDDAAKPPRWRPHRSRGLWHEGLDDLEAARHVEDPTGMAVPRTLAADELPAVVECRCGAVQVVDTRP